MSEPLIRSRQFLEKLPADAVEIPGFRDAYATPGGDIISTVRERPVKLRFRLSSAGYFQVGLYDCEGRRTSVLVHRILASLFVDGNVSLTVGHVDGNPRNNQLSNLRWLPRAENARLGRARHPEWVDKMRKALSRPVRGTNVRTGLVEDFPSVVAANTSVRGTRINYRYKSAPNGTNISRAIRAGRLAYGRKWEYL